MMKYLQKLGKALMLPVAVLPICGLLMGIGYALCPATMQGGDIKGVIPLIGLFLVIKSKYMQLPQVEKSLKLFKTT